MRKINSLHFGLPWIGVSLLVGLVILLVLRSVTGKFLWLLSVAGGTGLLSFLIVFLIENGKVPHYRKNPAADVPFDCEILNFLSDHWTELRFSPAVATVVKKVSVNPKRSMREARKQG